MNNPSHSGVRHPTVHSCNEPRHSAVVWPPRTISLTRLFIFAVLILGPIGQFFIGGASAQERYYRIQLKHGGQYLDADHCGNTITLNPGQRLGLQRSGRYYSWLSQMARLVLAAY